MKKAKKVLKVAGLLAIGLLAVSAVGCKTLSQKEDSYEYTGFLENSAEKVRLGSVISWEHFIDYVEDADYTITISDGVTTTDITYDFIWVAEAPGDYVISYTVLGGEHQGVYTHSFTVTVPRVTWSYSREPLVFFYEQEMQFADFFEGLNLAVDSYYDWTPFMVNVRIDDEITTFMGEETSYTINSFSDHYFTYGIRTEDGQTLKMVATVNVKYSSKETDLYINDSTDGIHTIEVAGATEVRFNGEVCSDATISAECITIEKDVLHDYYSGSNFVSIMTSEGEVRETLNVYTERYSFEGNNTTPQFIYWGDSNKKQASAKISSEYTTDGEKSLLLISSPTKWPQIWFKEEYLQMVFSDPEVSALAFDFIYVGSTQEHTYRDLELHYGVYNKQATSISCYSKTPTTIVITRENWEKNSTYVMMIPKNGNDAPGSVEKPMSFYLDNLRPLYLLEADSYFAHGDNSGTIKVELSGVTDVAYKGEAIPADKYTISQDGISIDKDYLLSEVGSYTLELVSNGRTYQKTINVYGDTNFENGDMGNFILWVTEGATTERSRKILEENGSKALVLTNGPAYYPSFTLSGDYLDAVFSDENVSSITWRMKVHCTAEEVPRAELTYNFGSGKVVTAFTCGEWLEFVFTRSDYNAYKAAEMTAITFTWHNHPTQMGGTSRTLQMWIDDIKTHQTFALETEYYYNNSSAEEALEVVLAGVTEVKYNGETVPADKLVFIGDSVSIDKAYLLSQVGSNELLFVTAARTYSKVVHVYGDVDFENGVMGDFIQWNTVGATTERSRAILEENGSKALVLTNGPAYYPSFTLSGAYLDAVFSDEKVASITWRMKVHCTAEEVTRAELTYNFGSGKIVTAFTCGEWKEFVFTRSDYNAYKAAEMTAITFTWHNHPDQMGGASRTLQMWIDDFKVVEKSLEVKPELDFEDGYGLEFFSYKGTQNGSFSIANNSVIEGEKALMAKVQRFQPGIEISLDYLAEAFKDEDVTVLTFKAYSTGDNQFSMQLNRNASYTLGVLSNDANNVGTYVITRAIYNAALAENMFYIYIDSYSGTQSDSYYTIYLDDFKVSRKNADAVEYDFENGDEGGFLTWSEVTVPAGTTKSVEFYDGSYALKMYTPKGTAFPALTLDKAYLDRVFADESVTALTFKILVTSASTGVTDRRVEVNQTINGVKEFTLTRDVWMNITITRAEYEALTKDVTLKIINQSTSASGGNKALTIYMDDFQITK